MAVKFGGFTDQQREVLARRMGFAGPMEKFGEYLQSSPEYQNKFVSYENKARQLVEGKAPPLPGFASGGAVARQLQRSKDRMTGRAPATGPVVSSPPQPQVDAQQTPSPAPSFSDGGMVVYNNWLNARNSGNKAETDKWQKEYAKWAIANNTGGTYNLPAWYTPSSSPAPQPAAAPAPAPAPAPTPTPAQAPAPSPSGTTVPANPTSTLSARVFDNSTGATPQVKVDPMQVSPDQMVPETSGQVTKSDPVTASQTAPTAQAAAPATTPAPQVTTATSAPAVASATQGMTAAKGTVSDQAKVEAATALPSANATVQGQLESLMKQFEGGETPPWAAGAIRNANAIMAQRGLGASSMAGAAVTQAAMESAISIAAQDAATFSQFEMTNLNNRQQARLVNAQAFLQMDLANLDAEQQMTMVKSQSIIQSLFTDQAAENASRQFNATSQGQTDQFFANLKTQVAQFNAAQTNAMEQFKAGQTDSVNMFNRQMNDAREQFNASNRLVIDQSNAEWRRAVTAANNAAINEANRINATNASGMTQAAYNNMMQRERDFYSFAFTAGENQLSRANELAMSKLNIGSAEKMAASESKSNAWSAAGSLAAALISKW